MIEIKENIPLKEHGTFRVGGPARFFALISDSEDVHEALAFRRSAGVPLFVLGGGSNMLFNDAGFAGLVMKIKVGGIFLSDGEVVAGAGVGWDDLVSWTVKRGLGGLENLSGIPGTVGGAVVGNIGAYGRELQNVLNWVEVINSVTGVVQRLSNKECQFEYRSSFFKTPVGRENIVTMAAFKVDKKARPSIEYPDILNYFEKREVLPARVTPHIARKAILEIRAAKMPDLGRIGTAGSFFKNPVIGKTAFGELKRRFPELPSFPVAESSDRLKIPAGWLLDKVCGYKGVRWGEVGTHEHQALVLVNFGGATSADIAACAETLATGVKAATGILLEREVEYL